MSALFAFGSGCEAGFGGGEGRVGFGWSWVRTRGRGGFGGDLGDLSSEGCLTISSEERETWTAASLRGFQATEDPEETS